MPIFPKLIEIFSPPKVPIPRPMLFDPVAVQEPVLPSEHSRVPFSVYVELASQTTCVLYGAMQDTSDGYRTPVTTPCIGFADPTNSSPVTSIFPTTGIVGAHAATDKAAIVAKIGKVFI